MEKLSCSRSFITSDKEETMNNMAPDEILFTSNDFFKNDSSYCDKCNFTKVKSVVFCKECGDMFLCGECNKKVHSGAKVKHSFENLPSLKEPLKSENKNGKVFESNSFKNAAKLNVTNEGNSQSFLLIDGSEVIKTTETHFLQNLQCEDNPRVKVVSIFGNTGDGKSHTLNHTFFNGADVFDTSSSQKSCTVGVWAAYDKSNKVLILDTEGLLGVSENSNKRMRLLLKVLAVSDVVIYRTRAERLHSDMFLFLGDASEAYLKYFASDLKSVKKRGKMDDTPLCNLGPTIIIFQETHYTLPLGFDNSINSFSKHNNQTPEDILRENFANIKRSPSAFSSISYVGTKTQAQPTNFSTLFKEVQKHLNNSSVRSPRPISVIYNALVKLNKKFGDDINCIIPNSFPDEYFTCTSVCQSCKLRCELSMNHEEDKVPHHTSQRCIYQAQFENKVYVCKICHEKGLDCMVCPKTTENQDSPLIGLAKYAWSGYVLECPQCGVIYRSRQYWYGNRDPVENSVRTEIKHVWPGSCLPHNHQNAARRFLDGMNVFASAITDMSAKPAKAVTNWITDKVAPSYWTPNYLILECKTCGHDFDDIEKKHHCRACGFGFCDNCTQHRIPCKDRGWGETPVRVCGPCFQKSGLDDQANAKGENIDLSELLEAIDDDPMLETGDMVSVKTSNNIPVRHPPDIVTTRKVTETVQSTLSYLTSTLELPLEYIVDSARPYYWVPDSDIIECSLCKQPFTNNQSKHHCRSCGKGFCDDCSKNRLPVPSRGWNYPCRVCDTCSLKKGPL
ncbi:zinc finger FYVE domain-containing protein 1 [Hydra vulgaris]|uniref:Zinc finger FYVE domain-containing protein 1 n=1 Tax=Hydra vulgaris TaxID=6087 RepID=A0ABM4CHR9_HYDVU